MALALPEADLDQSTHATARTRVMRRVPPPTTLSAAFFEFLELSATAAWSAIFAVFHRRRHVSTSSLAHRAIRRDARAYRERQRTMHFMAEAPDPPEEDAQESPTPNFDRFLEGLDARVV